jgi:signal transduction histidine kinase
LIAIPLLLVLILRETRRALMIGIAGIIISSLILCAVLLASTNIIPFTIIYISFFVVGAEDFFRQYLYFFILARKLKTTLETNIELAEQNKATELRHMIANVAHDLKTVG